MGEIASNELKFEPDMYFYRFYQILEDIFKICEIAQIRLKIEPFSTWSKMGSKMAMKWLKMPQIS